MNDKIEYSQKNDTLKIIIEERRCKDEYCLRIEPIQGVLKLELDAVTGNLLSLELMQATTVAEAESINGAPAKINYVEEDDTLKISLREDDTGDEGCDLVCMDPKSHMMGTINRKAASGSLTGLELIGFSKMVQFEPALN